MHTLVEPRSLRDSRRSTVHDMVRGKVLFHSFPPFFQAHGHWVRSLRLTPNGRMLLSGSGDSTIGLWEVNAEGTGARLMKLLQGHTNRVRCVRASHDGRLIFSGSCDMTVRCWELGS